MPRAPRKPRNRKKKHVELTSFHIRLIRQRLEEKCVRDELTGCLIWQGPRSTQRGYGTIYNPASTHPIYTHHAVLLVNGQPKPVDPPAPNDGYRWEIHHRCKNPLCCEPEHLVGWIGNRVHAQFHAGERAALARQRRAAKAKKTPRLVPAPASGAAIAMETTA
jgi:hypothetical protein